MSTAVVLSLCCLALLLHSRVVASEEGSCNSSRANISDHAVRPEVARLKTRHDFHQLLRSAILSSHYTTISLRTDVPVTGLFVGAKEDRGDDEISLQSFAQICSNLPKRNPHHRRHGHRGNRAGGRRPGGKEYLTIAASELFRCLDNTRRRLRLQGARWPIAGVCLEDRYDRRDPVPLDVFARKQFILPPGSLQNDGDRNADHLVAVPVTQRQPLPPNGDNGAKRTNPCEDLRVRRGRGSSRQTGRRRDVRRRNADAR